MRTFARVWILCVLLVVESRGSQIALAQHQASTNVVGSHIELATQYPHLHALGTGAERISSILNIFSNNNNNNNDNNNNNTFHTLNSMVSTLTRNYIDHHGAFQTFLQLAKSPKTAQLMHLVQAIGKAQPQPQPRQQEQEQQAQHAIVGLGTRPVAVMSRSDNMASAAGSFMSNIVIGLITLVDSVIIRMFILMTVLYGLQYALWTGCRAEGQYTWAHVCQDPEVFWLAYLGTHDGKNRYATSHGVERSSPILSRLFQVWMKDVNGESVDEVSKHNIQKETELRGKLKELQIEDKAAEKQHSKHRTPDADTTIRIGEQKHSM